MVFYVAEQISAITGKEMKDIITSNAAKAVLAGIVTDTGRFTFKNTRPETLESAGLLIELGGDISEVCYNLFDRKTKQKFRLSAKARSEVQFYFDDKFAMTVVPYSQFVEYNAGPDGVDDVVSAMRDIDGVELAIVLRELENGEIRGNIRSQDYFDCSKFAETYGGGGHMRAAGFTAKNIDIYKLAEDIVNKVQDAL
jgi:phosphoesterase RecJ-like protein